MAKNNVYIILFRVLVLNFAFILFRIKKCHYSIVCVSLYNTHVPTEYNCEVHYVTLYKSNNDNMTTLRLIHMNKRVFLLVFLAY